MKTAKIIPTSTLMVAALGLALGLAAAPALADPVDQFGCHGDHKPCGVGGDDGGGGKAFLFQNAPTCAGATATGPSFGNFSVAGNVLFDPNFIHVHFKLQLKDVDPGTYDILGNFDPEDLTDPFSVPSCTTGLLDFPACDGGICTLGHVAVTVKQNHRQGRTSGVLRLPPCEADRLTTVWVRVDVDLDDDGFPEVLRSTPVTIGLPPNEVPGCPTA